MRLACIVMLLVSLVGISAATPWQLQVQDLSRPQEAQAGQNWEASSSSSNGDDLIVNETYSLVQGLERTSWNFEIEEGARHVGIEFWISGIEGSGSGLRYGWCFEGKTPERDVRSCPTYNLGITVGSSNGRSLFWQDDIIPGNYSFTFSAPENLAELQVRIHVLYA